MSSVDYILWLTTPNKKSNKNQKELLSLAELFNMIVDSDRKLIPDFYDCGTNARAIFLYLTKIHREGNLELSTDELDRMYNQYRAWPDNEIALQSAKETLKNMKPGVMILSIRFWLDNDNKHQFGHVWIFDKLRVSESINIYQSALDQYMPIDYYNEYGNQIEAQKMLNKVGKLLKEDKWSTKTANLFVDIFKFMHGVRIGTPIRPEFFYTYLEY